MSAAGDAHPAFPVSQQNPMHGGPLEGFEGMSLRDYFAAKAMQSVLDGSWPDLQLSPKCGLSPIENSAVFAYQIADAMLAARKGGAS